MDVLVNGVTQLLTSPIVQAYALLHRCGFLEIRKNAEENAPAQ